MRLRAPGPAQAPSLPAIPGTQLILRYALHGFGRRMPDGMSPTIHELTEQPRSQHSNGACPSEAGCVGCALQMAQLSTESVLCFPLVWRVESAVLIRQRVYPHPTRGVRIASSCPSPLSCRNETKQCPLKQALCNGRIFRFMDGRWRGGCQFKSFGPVLLGGNMQCPKFAFSVGVEGILQTLQAHR